MKKNQMQLTFDAKSVNESFARVAVAAFLTELNPTLDEIADVKTAVSEAVTNAIIHAKILCFIIIPLCHFQTILKVLCFYIYFLCQLSL